MKIKFIKDEVKDVHDDQGQWLIDNGFAEQVNDEWPQAGDEYWAVLSDGTVSQDRWLNYIGYTNRQSIGNVFKTGETAKRFVDYLRAIEVIRQDDGFMKVHGDFTAAAIVFDDKRLIARRMMVGSVQSGSLYFDILEHAEASLSKHPDEWETITNYDWSKE